MVLGVQAVLVERQVVVVLLEHLQLAEQVELMEPVVLVEQLVLVVRQEQVGQVLRVVHLVPQVQVVQQVLLDLLAYLVIGMKQHPLQHIHYNLLVVQEQSL
jgi:hypothetical protein